MTDELFNEFFLNREFRAREALKFGFFKIGNDFAFTKNIFDEQFKFVFRVSKNGAISDELIEVEFGEKYGLHLVSGATGGFVSAVRKAYVEVLKNVSENCFALDVFKGSQVKKIIAHIEKKYGDSCEHLWAKSPENAIFRRQDNRKWYAVLITLSKRKLGIDSDELVNVMNLRIKPPELSKIVDGKKFFPAFHMNKSRWITIILDGSVNLKTIYKFIENSRVLALRK